MVRKAPHPGDLLKRGTQDQVCVLLSERIDDLRLPAQIISDIHELFPYLARISIAEDILHGAISREYVSRRVSPNGEAWRKKELPYTLDGSTSYALMAAILLRPEPEIREPHRPYRKSTQAERQALLRLLYFYGVECAIGTCCTLVPDPIKIPEDKSVEAIIKSVKRQRLFAWR